MMRSLVGFVLLVTGACLSVQPAAAQGFQVGYTDIGPTIGIGGIGSASVSFGGRFERGIKDLPSLGDGVLGIMVGVDYYSWSASQYKWSYIPIGATANYHFNIENEKIDPFLGLGLGYSIISCDWPGIGANLCSNSALYFIGRAGGRYFINPRLALYGDVGAGAATLNVGVTFKLQ